MQGINHETFLIFLVVCFVALLNSDRPTDKVGYTLDAHWNRESSHKKISTYASLVYNGFCVQQLLQMKLDSMSTKTGGIYGCNKRGY